MTDENESIKKWNAGTLSAIFELSARQVRYNAKLAPATRKALVEHNRAFRRFLIGGAAGGVVLTVSMAAAFVGKNGGVPWILSLSVFFLVLALCIGATISYREREEIEAEAVLDIVTNLSNDPTSNIWGLPAGPLKEPMRDAILRKAQSFPRRDLELIRRLEVFMMALLVLGTGTALLFLVQITVFP